MKDIMGLMKQAQAMQAKMADLQAELDNVIVEGQSGGGMVKMTMSAKGAMKSVSIDPSLFKPEEREIVEDLIVAAPRGRAPQGRGSRGREDEGGDRRPAAAARHEAAVLKPVRHADSAIIASEAKQPIRQRSGWIASSLRQKSPSAISHCLAMCVCVH